MAIQQRWLFRDDSANYLIELGKIAPGGSALVRINGATDTYVLSQLGDSGYFTLLPCGEHKCLLQLSLDFSLAALYIDEALQTPLPTADASPAARPAAAGGDSSVLQKRIKSGMGSFLTLIILSVINVALILFNTSVNFPFSVFTVTLSTILGKEIAGETGNNLFLAGGIFLSIVVIAAYVVLYALAQRRSWPVWVTFALIAADTLLLLGFLFLSESLSDSLLDILFHAWIIWSLFRLGQAKQRFNRLLMQQTVPTASQDPAER